MAGAAGVLAVVGALPLAACTRWPPPANPMAVRRIPARCAASSRCILLPGALSRAEEFVDFGFVADLHAAAPACDVVLADAHLGYFVEGQLLARLRADVVQPASGAIKPWLVGISLGGFAALAYAANHGDEIAGVLALAPYLGRRELLRDISAAGGPEAWSALASEPRAPHEAIEEDVWRWIARRAQEARRSRQAREHQGDQPALAAAPAPAGFRAGHPPVFLGYGRDDRFADALGVLQSLLPVGHTRVVAGDHDWPPWRMLWRQWLAQGWLGPMVGRGCGETTWGS